MALTKKFEILSHEEKRLVRVGYNRLNHSFLNEEGYQNLSAKELDRYLEYGRAVVNRENKRTIVIATVVAVFFAVGLALYFQNTKNQAEVLSTHYTSIAAVDVCATSLKTVQLFSTDIYLDGVLPANPATKHDSNHSSSCNFFIKGTTSTGSYIAFVKADVEKSKVKQKTDTQQDASLLTDTPYKVFKYDGQKDFYSISVNVGIDPKDTTLSKDTSDNLSKVLVLLVGTGIADGLPSNPNATNVK